MRKISSCFRRALVLVTCNDSASACSSETDFRLSSATCTQEGSGGAQIATVILVPLTLQPSPTHGEGNDAGSANRLPEVAVQAQ